MGPGADPRIAKTTVVICTVDRSTTLEETVASLSAQAVRPLEIIVSVPDVSSVSLQVPEDLPIRVIQASGKGLTKQRNSVLEHIRTMYTLFLDDDVELSSNFIRGMQALFDKQSQIVLASAALAADGTRSDVGITREDAKLLLSSFRPEGVTSCQYAYGCNMFVKSALLKQIRFDEELPLYGWLEDREFSIRSRRYGRVVRNSDVCLVHLGFPSGRMSGLRLGYSQIANPLYLWSKLAEPTLTTVLFGFWMKLLAANAAWAALFWLRKRGDRRGRLVGNLLAFRDLLRGRMHPGQILKLISH